MVDGIIGTLWESQLVAWDDFTIDMTGQRIFAFDTEGEERRLIGDRDTALAVARDLRDQGLRDLLIAAVVAREVVGDWRTRLTDWNNLKRKFLTLDLVLPGEHELDPRFRNIACGVLSAFSGKPVGYGFDKLIQVAHHLADNYPEGLIPFGHALRLSSHASILTSQDKFGRWSLKAAKHRAAVRAEKSSYLMSEDLRALLSFLFPALAQVLSD